VMRIRFAKFSPVPSDPHLAHNTLPGLTEGKVGELCGRAGEGESEGERIRRVGETETRAHVVFYSLAGSIPRGCI